MRWTLHYHHILLAMGRTFEISHLCGLTEDDCTRLWRAFWNARPGHKDFAKVPDGWRQCAALTSAIVAALMECDEVSARHLQSAKSDKLFPLPYDGEDAEASTPQRCTGGAEAPECVIF